MKKTRILFVCKWNRFRSKAAEAILKKLDTKKRFNVQSAGLFLGIPVSKDIIEAGKKIGIKINKKPQGLSQKLIMWTDYIIIVADDVPKEIFREIIKNDGKKVIQWKLKDISGTNINKRKQTMIKIKKEIQKFIKNED